MDTSKDCSERRCPRLGHTVSFKYCRESGGELGACFKLVDCWWEYFDIQLFLLENFSEDTVKNLTNATPKPKTSHILELIETAKSRLKE